MHIRCSRTMARATLTCATLTLALSAGAISWLVAAVAPAKVIAPVDLDVSAPPGLPLDWLAVLPNGYTRPESAVPTRAAPLDDPANRYGVARERREVRNPSGFGLVRILTWDVTAHLQWTVPSLTESRPRATTGSSWRNGVYPPPANRPLYWMSMSALLRQMLHPARAPRGEVLAYLLQLGDSAYPAIAAAMSESSLRSPLSWLRAQIGTMPAEPPRIEASASPFETMMRRFTAEELVGGHPFDPDLSFASRMFLLGESATSAASVHVLSEHSLLRRNAVVVVSRLGIHGVEDVLRRVLENSEDEVERIRAIRSLGVSRSEKGAQALIEALERLSARTDPWILEVEGSALVHALGVCGRGEATVALLEWAQHEKRDGDALMALLAAFCRLDAPREQRTALVEWLEKVRPAFASVNRWREPNAALVADRPDADALRARILQQFVRCALARQQGMESEFAKEVLEWPKLEAFEGESSTPSMGRVLEVVAPAYLAVLSKLGLAGAERLQAVLDDPQADVGLRELALEAFPGRARFEAARRLASDQSLVGAQFSLRLSAFQLLDAAGHPALLQVAQSFFPDIADASLDTWSAAQQYGLLLATTALGRLGKLPIESVRDWLGRMDLRPLASETLRQELADRVDAMIGRGAVVPMKQLEGMIDELLAKVAASPARSPIRGSNLADHRERLRELLDPQRTENLRRSDRQWWVQSIVDWLLGAADPPGQRAEGIASDLRFQSVVPLREMLILELGRSDAASVVPYLVGLCRQERLPERAVACLALAATARKEAGPALVEALGAADGFVRLCAYLGLRDLTGQDFFCDWLYTNAAERNESVRRYREWVDR